MSIKRLFGNSFFSIAAKVTNAVIQLLSLPLLLKVFGKENYGLIVIAMSLNTFIAILQLGLPIGIPKFIAEWLAKGEYKQLNSATRTVFSFYLAIALVNFLVLLTLALFGLDIFKVNPDQIGMLQTLLFITAITSLLAIPAASLDQLLTGAQDLWFISSLEIIKNFFFAGLVAFIYFWPKVLSITEFYVLRCALMFMMVPTKVWRWTVHGSLGVFIPGWDFQAVAPVLKYCLYLMTFSIFIALANKLRPIILGVQISSAAGEALADYQIINYIRMFLMMFTSSFMAALIPHISNSAVKRKSHTYITSITKGTKYIWAFGALVGFGLIMLSKEVLCIYVGVENLYLKTWLEILLIGSLYNLYVAPIASVILSSGKLAPMVFATTGGCLASLLICWFLTPEYGIGAIAISLIAYNLVHLLVTHFWYLPRYFNVKPIPQIVNIMLPPALAGVAMCFAGRWSIDHMRYTNNYINIAIGTVCGTVIYLSIILTTYIRPAKVYKDIFCFGK